jgi:hypothetical protein
MTVELAVQKPLELPSKVAAEYLRRFDIAALAILAPSSGLQCAPVATIDLGTVLSDVRKTWAKDIEPPTLAAAWWVSGIRPAQGILNLVLACDLRGYPLERGRLGVSVAKISEAIIASAARLRIGLTDYATGLARVQGSTQRLEDLVDEAELGGLLKPFNAEYRRRRQAAKAAGRPFMNYGTARSRLQAALAGAAASGGIDTRVIATVFRDGPLCSPPPALSCRRAG